MGRLWRTTRGGKRVRTAEGRRHEYDKFQSSEEAKKDRASRNAARRYAISRGMAHKGDSRDVDHIHGVKAGNSPSNLRVLSRSENRGRSQKSRKRGSRRKKWAN